MVTGEKEYNIIYNNKQHLFPFSCLYKVKMLIPYQNGISPVPYMGKSREVATFIKEQADRG